MKQLSDENISLQKQNNLYQQQLDIYNDAHQKVLALVKEKN